MMLLPLAILAIAQTTLQEDSMISFEIHPERERQVIDNFGASDCWTVDLIGHWPLADRKQIADLLFSQKKGIGLSCWRFNLGGGIDHELITNPHRTVASYEASPGKYDWGIGAGKQWFLQAAKERGVDQFVAFANTPPRSLTLNGHARGTDGLGATNLKPGAAGAYAKYLVDIAEHFSKKKKVHFTHISPINEPDFEWNETKQEGCRYSNEDILEVCSALQEELAKRKFSSRILAPEASSIQVSLGKNTRMQKKYGKEYGDYLNLFEKEKDWIQKVQPVFGYHSYWSEGLLQIIPTRKRMRKALDKHPELPVWQTEYCQMSGPHGEGGGGRDLGMGLALNVARLIHFDLTIVEARAWQWWIALSDVNFKDGLIYVDEVNQPSGPITPTKTLWAVGNYSRFVRPGMVRVEVEGADRGVNGPLISAYKDKKTGKVVIVGVNLDEKSRKLKLGLSSTYEAIPYETSDAGDLAERPKVQLGQPVELPPRSVVTWVCTPR